VSVTGCEAIHGGYDSMATYYLQPEPCNWNPLYKSSENYYLAYDSFFSEWIIGSGGTCDSYDLEHVWSPVYLSEEEPFEVTDWDCYNPATLRREEQDLEVTCAQFAIEWALTAADDHNHLYATGGREITPYHPHEDDDWSCQVNGQSEFKSCLAIEISCEEEGGTRNPTQTPTFPPTYHIQSDFQISNFYMMTQKQHVIGIDFDNRRYESVVEETFYGFGIGFTDQYSFLVSENLSGFGK